MAMIIPEPQRFLFDLQGFLHLEGVLEAGECARLRALVRELEARAYDDASWMANAAAGGGKPMSTRDGELPQLRLNGLLRLDAGFDALIDHPGVLPYIEELMASPQLGNTWSNCKGQRDAAHPIGWHRGIHPTEYSVRQGRIRSAMLNVIWFLDDNGPEDGCMVTAPGSHKNSIDLDWSAYASEPLPGMRRLVGRQGDVLLMSEAVLHDGMARTTPGSRTNLYFNYVAARFNVMTLTPEHNRHFCMPRSVRARFNDRQRALTAWMEHAAPVLSRGGRGRQRTRPPPDRCRRPNSRKSRAPHGSRAGPRRNNCIENDQSPQFIS